MPTFRFKPGSALTVFVGLVTVGALVLVGSMTMSHSTTLNNMGKSKGLAAVSLRPASREGAGQLAMALAAVGLTPKPLAASGLGETDVAAIVAHAKSHMTSDAGVFAAAQEHRRSTSQAVLRLETKVRNGTGGETALAALEAERIKLTAANAEWDRAVNGLWSDATVNLPESARTTLRTIHANRRRELPIEYLAVDRDDGGWAVLSEALANDRSATRTGGEPDATLHQIILTARENATVIAAVQGLGNLHAVETAWNAAVRQ